MVKNNKVSLYKRKWILFPLIFVICIALIIFFYHAKQSNISGKIIKTSTCEKKPDRINRNNCLVQLAILENDPETCNLIDDKKLFYACVVSIAKQKRDISYCRFLGGQDFGKCLYEVSNSM